MRDPFKKLMGNIRTNGRSLINGEWILNYSPQKSRRSDYLAPKILIDVNDLRNLWKHQNGKCYWLGIDIPPMAIFEKYHPMAMSVDRIDNSLNYSLDNVVLSCRLANIGRGSYDAELFSKTVDYIRNGITEVSHNVIMNKTPNSLW